MSESDLLRRYALALHLIPDSAVAGDLFMAAPDEPSLLRLVNRWRRAQGLPEVAVLPADLPPLSPPEVEHALHLGQRARRRSRLRRALWGLAGLVVALLLLVLGAGIRPWPAGAARGLATDPVYTGAPLERFEQGGFQIWIHRLEADPGRVTLWWSAAGPGAAQAGSRLEPRLRIDSMVIEWMTPSENLVEAQRENRLVGRATFETVLAGGREALLLFGEADTEPLRLPLAVKAEPSARTIPINRTFEQGPVSFRIYSLVLGRNYTLVQYRSSLDPRQLQIQDRQTLTPPKPTSLFDGKRALLRKGQPYPDDEGSVMTAAFEGIGQEIPRLYLHFTPIQVTLPTRLCLLTDPDVTFVRSGSSASVSLNLPEQPWGGSVTTQFIGAKGERYPAQYQFRVEGRAAQHTLTFQSDLIPEGVELTGFTVSGLHQYVGGEPIVLELPAVPPPATGAR